jgi:C4-dicarboxylate-specific signal transduction histidine kinase
MAERVAVTDEFYYPQLNEWVENHMYPSQDGGLVTFQRYVTNRRRTEDELYKTQIELAHAARLTTMGEFAASIAHEVNQPLGAIVTNGQACLRLLSKGATDLSEARAAIENTVSDAMRAGEVIKRFRSLLRKAEPEKVAIDINYAIREVLKIASGELDLRKVRSETELGDNLPKVLGDRVQIQQVILNLILNAKDAMTGKRGQKRALKLSSYKDSPGTVTVEVQDSGRGISPKVGERIFDSFFTTKTRKGSLGLGLSISKNIVESHGGRIWATRNEDAGMTFRFTIPTNGGDQ